MEYLISALLILLLILLFIRTLRKTKESGCHCSSCHLDCRYRTEDFVAKK